MPIFAPQDSAKTNPIQTQLKANQTQTKPIPPLFSAPKLASYGTNRRETGAVMASFYESLQKKHVFGGSYILFNALLPLNRN